MTVIKAVKVKKAEARPYIACKYIMKRGQMQSEIYNAIEAYQAAWVERGYSPVGRLGIIGKTKSRSVKFPETWLNGILEWCRNHSITFSEICNEALEWRERSERRVNAGN